MVLFNYAIREVTAKLVYYGPGLCGKTTNLQFIHEKLDPSARGKLLSLATDGDRTLFFDFLPIEMGSIGGYKVRFQLYTVPGQVHYNATRKLVLKGVDAVAFVADSQLSMLERNRESFQNLIENLIENGYDPAKIPIVIQLNKRDLPEVASVGDLVGVMGVEGYPVCEAVASRGDGVFETLKTIVKLTLSRLRTQFDVGGDVGGAGAREAPPPPPPPPPLPSAVFAASPPPPAEEPPVPEAPAPRPLEAETEIPAEPIDGLDEFDLEDFSDEPAEPVAADGPEVDSGEEFPEDPDDRRLLAGRRAGRGPSPWRPSRMNGPSKPCRSMRSPPPRSLFAQELPPWAVEMMEELQRLRVENNGLRDALRGIRALLDRQIGVLQDGREELERHVGEDPGESSP